MDERSISTGNAIILHSSDDIKKIYKLIESGTVKPRPLLRCGLVTFKEIDDRIFIGVVSNRPHVLSVAKNATDEELFDGLVEIITSKPCLITAFKGINCDLSRIADPVAKDKIGYILTIVSLLTA